MAEPDPILTIIDGKRFWRDPVDGRTVPYISGGSEDGGDGGDGTGDGGTGGDTGTGTGTGDGGDAGKTFTQADLDRIAGQRANEARRKAEKDMKDFLAAQKAEADRAAMTEADRAKAEAAEIIAAAAADRAAAAAERQAAKVERRLLAAGLEESSLARATRLLNLDSDASDDDIDADIAAVKTELPGLFTATGDGAGKPNPPKPPAGKVPTPPKGGQSDLDATAAAHAELRRMGLEPQPRTKTAA